MEGGMSGGFGMSMVVVMNRGVLVGLGFLGLVLVVVVMVL